MTRRDWLKVIVLILVPANAWLLVFYYLHRQRQTAIYSIHDSRQYVQEYSVIRHHFREKWGLQIGRRLTIPYPSEFIGPSPPFRQGYPTCFLYISGLVVPEVWEPAIFEALKASPYLHVVLLYSAEGGKDSIRQMVQKFKNPRLSALIGNWIHGAFGSYEDGILLVLCDGEGIVRAIEPYPKLKVSPFQEEEVKDWRPKLHQAVKRALEKFFGKPSGKQ
jgi:hypothetical protein